MDRQPTTQAGVTEQMHTLPPDHASLEPAMPTGEAVRVVSRWLLETIRANEDGVLRGEDPEHLHDFRVAVRRTRTLLSELAGALPEHPMKHFRREFKWLGRSTGPIRDLDVWILKQPGYRQRLPQETRSDLGAFEAHLRLKRDGELVRLVRTLRSARYANLLEDWEEFLWRPATGGIACHASDRPIFDVASARIWRAYRKALKQGGKVGPASPRGEMHKLRIRCKKLRYLLEFFGGLYAPEAVSASIEALKTLQDHLGDFNDLSVQRRLLPEFARELAACGGEDTAAAIEALGRLEAILKAAQKEERERTEHCFDRFQQKENRSLFKELFAPT